MRRAGPFGSGWVVIPLPMTVLGCAPTVDIGGVYFPAWLMSAMIGLVVAYGTVSGLSRYPASRDLSDSGLFFVGLFAFAALSIWWLFFRGF